jgi:transmembrane sensor
VAQLVDFNARTAIEHEARKWLIRMDGDEPLTDTERAALKDWMSRSKLHRSELVRLCNFWSGANILTDLVGSLESARRQRKEHRSLGWRPTILMAAGATLASVMLVYWALTEPGRTVTYTYGTSIGQQTTFPLSDGSSIQLNTNTQVQVAYTGNSRRIRLLRGEALFTATPDPKRAFEVYAADSIVRAVGTAFTVHLEGRKVDVIVEKGIVDVSEVSSTRTNLGRLRAHDATSLDSGNGRIEVHHLTDTELQRRMSWREGYLAFSGEPLSEVVAQLNRYSTKTLEIGNPKLASIAIGGRFKIGDLDSVLDLLNTTFGIRSRQINDSTIQLESDLKH